MTTLVLDSFRDYLQQYVDRLYDLELTPENFGQLLATPGNERHQYPLYFLWLLPEFRPLYLKARQQDYMLLGHNFLQHMTSLPQYNSTFVSALAAHAVLPLSLKSPQRLRAAKSRLGWKSIHLLDGCQKFIWSWASIMESYGRELSAARA